MKTKLLRKVRKRFHIEYIESVGFSVTSIRYAAFLQMGEKPFYFIYDDFGFGNVKAVETKEEAYNALRWMIHKEYWERIKGYKEKIVKVF